MPVRVNELMWAAHDRDWVRAALILEGFTDHGCFESAIKNLLVRSPDKEACERLRPEDPFKVPNTTILHLLSTSKPGDHEDRLWNAYYKVWELAAAVLHNNPAVDARAGLPGSGGKTALMIAAVQNNPTAMLALLDSGAGGLRSVRD